LYIIVHRFAKFVIRTSMSLSCRTFLRIAGGATFAFPAISRTQAGASLTQQQKFNMEIKRVGSQPSSKGPADWFTGTVRIDPLFQPNAPARTSGATVTFEPRGTRIR
jgi:hypothetical protein